jgi:nicotinate-nucleotide adenylyltransferase
MKTVLFGGTFNPPHIGHLLTVKALSELYDRVIVMPAAVPPHKQLPDNSFSADERLELSRLTFGGFENVEVSDLEIRNGGVCYTIDTINKLNVNDLTLAVGTDMLFNIEKWRNFEDILKHVNIAVLRRNERSIGSHINHLKLKYGANVTVIDTKIVEISSTQLRFEAGAIPGNTGAMPPNPRADFIRAINPRRLAHSLGTECEAVKLAEHYGVDAYNASTAALLHDCTKYWTTERHLQYCKECNIIDDKGFSRTSQLLHGITAAELARREFDVSDGIYNAIRYHTTGRPGMSKLELIIYLADKLEPTREYKDIPEFKKIAYTDSLERAVLAIMDMHIMKLTDLKKNIHPLGIEARNYLFEVLSV